MEKSVTINEEKINQLLAEKIAAYWNGRIINVTSGVGAQWSDWTGDETNWRYRVQGTRDRVEAVTGIISATANGNTVEFMITYNIQISNIG